MRLTKEEANAYQGYALTPEQLIKKAKKFYDDLTPEEKNQEYDIFGNKTNSEKITTAKVTVGEFYAHCVEDIENRYKEFKKISVLNNKKSRTPLRYYLQSAHRIDGKPYKSTMCEALKEAVAAEKRYNERHMTA